MSWSVSTVEIIFLLTLLITFVAAFLGRRHSTSSQDGLADEKLNRWLIGLSAGATANSGFIVTGAVGLGFAFGPQWIFLPISWFLGDLVFWRFFPHLINRYGEENKVTTLSELLSVNISGKAKVAITMLVSLLIIVGVGGYTTAQWIAGQKFVSGAFNFSAEFSLLLFALVIIAYSSIGGFRGSVYADSVQAVIRLIGTILALVMVILAVFDDPETFNHNISAAGEQFMNWLPGTSIASIILFVLGFAFASLGFGLGQPQLVSRYLAGASPEETQSAKWIYIFFVQFTWISMTLFGVLLRGVMPDIDDPETGLSVFFANHANQIVAGIIVADIYATIAATSNSLLVAMAQSVVHDLFKVGKNKTKSLAKNKTISMVVLLLGGLTMLGAIVLNNHSSVFELAISSVSLLGAGLAAPVLIKLTERSHTGASLIFSIILGLASALVWKFWGLSDRLNEAAIGIVVGYLGNWVFVKVETSELATQ